MTDLNCSESNVLLRLLEDYNQCFYQRDLKALQRLYVDEGPFVYFDNHADCDALSLPAHLQQVQHFFESGEIVSLQTEVLALSFYGDSGLLVARVGYGASSPCNVRLSLFAEKHAESWKIRHLHYSQDPTLQEG